MFPGDFFPVIFPISRCFFHFFPHICPIKNHFFCWVFPAAGSEFHRQHFEIEPGSIKWLEK